MILKKILTTVLFTLCFCVYSFSYEVVDALNRDNNTGNELTFQQKVQRELDNVEIKPTDKINIFQYFQKYRVYFFKHGYRINFKKYSQKIILENKFLDF